MIQRSLTTNEDVVRAEGPAGRKRYTWVMSTSQPCKDGIIVVQDWDFSEFEKNPVILAEHERSASAVIGRGFNPRIDEAGRAVVDIEFDSAIDEETGQPSNPLARQIEKAVDAGFIRAGSVGFRPGSIALRKNFPKESPHYADGDDGYAPVLGADGPNLLFEFSICAIGADSNALRLRKLVDEQGPESLLKLHLLDMLRNDPDVREAARSLIDNEPETDEFSRWWAAGDVHRAAEGDFDTWFRIDPAPPEDE